MWLFVGILCILLYPKLFFSSNKGSAKENGSRNFIGLEPVTPGCDRRQRVLLNCTKIQFKIADGHSRHTLRGYKRTPPLLMCGAIPIWRFAITSTFLSFANICSLTSLFYKLTQFTDYFLIGLYFLHILSTCTNSSLVLSKFSHKKRMCLVIEYIYRCKRIFSKFVLFLWVVQQIESISFNVGLAIWGQRYVF